MLRGSVQEWPGGGGRFHHARQRTPDRERTADADRWADFDRGGAARSERRRCVGRRAVRRSFLLGEGGALAGLRLEAAVFALSTGFRLRTELHVQLRPARGAILHATRGGRAIPVPVSVQPVLLSLTAVGETRGRGRPRKRRRVRPGRQSTTA